MFNSSASVAVVSLRCLAKPVTIKSRVINYRNRFKFQFVWLLCRSFWRRFRRTFAIKSIRTIQKCLLSELRSGRRSESCEFALAVGSVSLIIIAGQRILCVFIVLVWRRFVRWNIYLLFMLLMEKGRKSVLDSSKC